ncbi:MAG: putative zinc-finger, partial [Candidatus Poribacteria bacterium]|nr:putative zinc-finger [Candidatus Poribacteria bacterium]
MHCELVVKLLDEYIEGELDESRQVMIETHLADCESCRRELALSQNIPHLVNSLPTTPVPESIIPNTL